MDSSKDDKKELKLVDVEITNENMALNVLISFVNQAQKRGAFGIDESAKIWECITLFSSKRTRNEDKNL